MKIKETKDLVKPLTDKNGYKKKKSCAADYVVKTCIRLSGICKSIFQSTAICKCKNA